VPQALTLHKVTILSKKFNLLSNVVKLSKCLLATLNRGIKEAPSLGVFAFRILVSLVSSSVTNDSLYNFNFSITGPGLDISYVYYLISQILI
jgi:hypothetical protein